MDKETFLRLQYLRMINSDEFVSETWRSSCERFIADMWDRTPKSPGARFLSPVDGSLGFSQDNVEWQFPKVRRRGMKKSALPVRGIDVLLVPKRPTKEERRASDAAEREARRKAIAEEISRWEELRRAKSNS